MELIFFAVIIFFSIIESIARSRRAKEGGGVEEDVLTERGVPTEWEAPEHDLPTYDEDPSYDDDAIFHRSTGGPGRSMSEYTKPRGDANPPRGPRASAPPSGNQPGATDPSTEMLPGDLLEQLAELAGPGLRGRMERAQARTAKVPERSPSLPGDEEGSPPGGDARQGRMATGRALTTRPARAPAGRPEHRIHRSHAGYGTDPSERAPSEQDGLDPLATRLSADALAVRKSLLDHDPHSLRQALVLQEILGPPAAMANRRFFDDD